MLRYSTFTRYDDSSPTVVAEDWNDLKARLLAHTITDDKYGMALFNGGLFTRGSRRRNHDSAHECVLLILDFDNAKKVLDDAGRPVKGPDGKVLKTIADAPLQPEDVMARLLDWTFVLYTSHSHTAAWPRFRVVLPLAQPVPGPVWQASTRAWATGMGLLALPDGVLDACFMSVAHQYFWPSCPAGAAPFTHENTGALLELAPATAPIPVGKHTSAPAVAEYTAEQVAAFYAHELADLAQTEAEEWVTTCPLHASGSRKFYVNARTGIWCCHTACGGGNMATFAMKRRALAYHEARQYVGRVVGRPAVQFTVGDLKIAIGASYVADIPDLIGQIAEQPANVRTVLRNTLVAKHQLDADIVRNAVLAAAYNIITFPGTEGAHASAQAGQEGPPDDYGLRLDPARFELASTGLWVPRFDTKGQPLANNPPLADRPIWPAAMGFDYATESTLVQLAWTGSKGRHHEAWVPETALRDKVALNKLDDAPISLMSVGPVSSFLVYAKTVMADETMLPLSSRVGWAGDDLARRFVLPDDPVITYTGPRLDVRGSLDGWFEGVDLILTMGDNAFRALTVAGLCAASPLVRLIRRRNPLVGLVHATSTGKTHIISWAQAMWEDAVKLTIPANISTNKGIQDAPFDKPDLPFYLDEMQQVKKADQLHLENLFYALVNGQQRVTSSVTQQARGGRQRFGTAFFATEDDVVHELQLGAQARVLMLTGEHKPLHDQAMANQLKNITDEHYGAVGRQLAALLNDTWAYQVDETRHTAEQVVLRGGLLGNDHFTVALAVQGLRMLCDLRPFVYDEAALIDWLVAQCWRARGTAVSQEGALFVNLLETLWGMPWGKGTGDADRLETVDGGLAWRGTHINRRDPLEAPLEINPSHPIVKDMLQRRKLQENVAFNWIERGWVLRQSKHHKWSRSSGGHTPGAMVWRVTPAGIAHAGVGMVTVDEEVTCDDHA